MVTAEELTERITKWVARNVERESGFLNIDPQWNINAKQLLDYIVEVTGVSPEQIDKWITEKEVNNVS